MRPSGELGSATLLRARSTILLHPTGASSIELMRTKLPASARRLRAVLLNPGALDDADPVCQPVELELRCARLRALVESIGGAPTRRGG